MGLETATYVQSLEATNPVTSDRKSQGDDHLRLIKSVVKNTLPNASKPYYFPTSVTKTANYTVLASEENKIFLGDATAGPFDFTLPSLLAGQDGWSVRIVKVDVSGFAVGVVGTMNEETDYDLIAQWDSLVCIWTGTQWIRLHVPRFNADGSLILPGSITGGDVTLSGVLTLSAVTAMVMNNGTTAERPSTPLAGHLRFNNTLALQEFYDGGAWRQPSLAQPISAGFKQLVVGNNSGTPNTKIDISADAVTVETAIGVAYRLMGVSLTIDCGTTGANGLDSGGLAISTSYVALVIYNPATDAIAGLMTTEAKWIAGTYSLPVGYTARAMVYWNRTNASGQFARIRQMGRTASYVVGTGSPTPNLPLMGTGLVGAWTAVALAAFTPSQASRVRGMLGIFTSGGGSSVIAVAAPNNAYATSSSQTNPPPTIATASDTGVVGTSQYVPFDFGIEGANIYWGSTSGNGRLWCCGFELNI